MITITEVANSELESLLIRFDISLKYLKEPPYYVQNINSYPIYISHLLKLVAPENDSIYDIFETKILHNRELENCLQNSGFTVDELTVNPKNVLLEMLYSIKKQNFKFNSLIKIINEYIRNRSNQVIISNNENIDIFYEKFEKHKNIKLLRFTELSKYIKSFESDKKYLNHLRSTFFIDYTIDGYHDFLKYYNTDYDIHLILYKPEIDIYNTCLSRYKKELEFELLSTKRESFTGIKYEPIISYSEKQFTISETFDTIIQNSNKIDYDEFKIIRDNPYFVENEHIDITFQFEDNSCITIDSNESFFDNHNRLLKAYRVKENDYIRVSYNTDKINLYHLASSEEEETFSQIENYSQLWHKELLNYYKNECKSDTELIFNRLKEHGLTVKLSTMNNYLDKKVMFPMRIQDIKAILKLTKGDNVTDEIKNIIKYRRIYNGFMIALGRGLNEEIRTFLTMNEIGEIIKKIGFTMSSFRNFIDKSMPLKRVINIQRQINNQ